MRVLNWMMVSVFAAAIACKSSAESAQPSQLDQIELPPGFKIGVFAAGLKGARSMTLGEKGTIFVGSMREGSVYAIRDPNGDGVAEEGFALDGLRAPNGVAFGDGDLYVGEVSRILRFDDIESRLDNPPEPAVVYDGYPTDTHHGWKHIRFGPDGWLYVPVGAPCNVCEKEDPRYASITRLKPGGGEPEIFAKGVRNSVGFDWHPDTKELWFTDNGRDQMGDDVPPDELNRAPKKGLHFGFPHCHGRSTPDPEFGAEKPCAEFAAPEVPLGPHVAALGMRFYTGKSFPKEYRNAIFIAEHGSWNRTTPIGYRIMVVRPDAKGEKRYQPFASGWLRPDGPWGRPVDVLVQPDGSLLVSDDLNGVIYRISYAG